jgi:uncharacterized protein (TIGR02444 family)
MQALCLELQDSHRQCVALLLWRLWTLDQKRRISWETVTRAVEAATAWNDEVLIPLRAVRIGLTPSRSLFDHAVRLSLRDEIQTTELASERVLLDALERLAPAPGEVVERPLDAMEAMIEVWGQPAPTALLARLVAAP